MKQDNPEDAIDEFLGVPPLEEEKGDWCVFCPVAVDDDGLYPHAFSVALTCRVYSGASKD